MLCLRHLPSEGLPLHVNSTSAAGWKISKSFGALATLSTVDTTTTILPEKVEAL